MIRESDGPSYRGKRFLWIRRKDICTREGEVYLSRWIIAQLFGWALMLHVMRRPDQDRCHHDHPWPFVTLVLRGGYREQITDLTTGAVREQLNRPGALLYRPAIHTHRVAALPGGSCTTLVLRGPRRRVWGFRNADGRWRPWDAFVDWAGTVLWCDEGEEAVPYCGAGSPEGYLCTREIGHTGLHVAESVRNEVYATWSETGAAS